MGEDMAPPPPGGVPDLNHEPTGGVLLGMLPGDWCVRREGLGLLGARFLIWGPGWSAEGSTLAEAAARALLAVRGGA
ncbi:MAG: hypothetical protein KTR31_12160 [Myxococcales bacterium]|nr:hypothetical protein [Myxococcales bacterium]